MRKSIPRIQQVLNIFGIILILWSLYRWKLDMPDWFDEFIAKPVVFVLPVYWFITRQQKKNFFESIWLKSKDVKGDIFIGLFLGAVFVGSALFANFIRNGSFLLSGDVFTSQIILAVVITFFTATFEEILTRGFILKELFEDSKNMYLASFNASILFLILHIPILFTIPELRGTLLILFLATDFILSLVNSFIFLDRRSLISPILIHAFYNIAILMYV